MEDISIQNEPVVINDNKPKPVYPPISFGEWMLTMLLVSIPIAGFVLLVVWGFSVETNPSKANWAKATLVWMAIIIFLYLIIFAVLFLIVGSSFSEFWNY